MKSITRFLFVPLIVGAALLAACTVTPAQKQEAVKVGTVAAKATLNLAQVVVDAAVQTIYTKATSTTDATAKGNLLDSAAGGLRSLEGKTDGLVTPALVETTVRAYTNPDVTHWGDLATTVATAYSTGTGTQDQKLEALATGAETAAAKVPAVVDAP